MQPTAILIVDDDPAVRSFLKEMLLAYEGLQLVTAKSGREALEHIADREFDLVLLDLKMRRIGGIEVLTELREQWPDTPVIVLTAHASLETAVEAVRLGAYDYLFKPCRTDVLRACVRKALQARQQKVRQREILNGLSDTLEALRALDVEATVPPASDSKPERQATEGDRFLQWKNLIIDQTRHVVTLDGYLLDLSPTQFDMLTYLVSEAPRVISPQELVQAVHDYEDKPALQEALNIARSHVYQIRRSVKAATGRRDIIRTVRGIGYTMDVDSL